MLDTTYVLPLARIGVDTDLLMAVVENKTSVKLSELTISLISLFELQAKAAKLRIPAKFVNESIRSIVDNFTVRPFSDPRVMNLSFELRRQIADYIDCIIIATAAAQREALVTEDSRIWKNRESIHEKYGVQVLRYQDVLTAG